MTEAALFPVDQGQGFGLWPDATSRLMYHDAMPALLNGVDLHGRVADYGGGNGLLKAWIPQAFTIDADASKGPDLVADVATHVGSYDLVVMRYLLHYLSDLQLVALFDHLASFHAGRLLVIQFVNDDLVSKLANSVNETKWFRGEADLRYLIDGTPWRITSRKRLDYVVDAEFYRQRLLHPNPTSHEEAVVAYELERR